MDLPILFWVVRISPRELYTGEPAVSPAKGLLVATRNPDKLRELEQMLADLPFVVTNLADFSDIAEVEETGKTFVENAVLKAAGYATQTSRLTLADDSGLEIDELKGAPG